MRTPSILLCVSAVNYSVSLGVVLGVLGVLAVSFSFLMTYGGAGVYNIRETEGEEFVRDARSG
jgi:hypothetical protein